MALGVILMGVSGCGKTTVGNALAARLGWPFYDGDDYHPAENVAKMSQGIPLTDADRWPWLDYLGGLLRSHLEAGESVLLACSALKQSYRDRLADGLSGVMFVHLRGDFNLLNARMLARRGHYMKAEMLRSQLETLEEPRDALVVEVDQAPEAIVEQIIVELAKLAKQDKLLALRGPLKIKNETASPKSGSQ